MVVENCYCCGKDVSTGEPKKRRYRLDNVKVQDSLYALISLVTEVNGVDVNKLKDGYGCRSCVDTLKSYDKLRKSLRSKLSHAIPLLPKASTAGIDSPVPLPTSSRSSQETPVVHSEATSPAMTVCFSNFRVAVFF